MAVQYIGKSTFVSNIASITQTFPTYQSGDLLVMLFSSANQAPPNDPAGSGWTLIDTQTIGSAGVAGGNRISAWYKFAGASETAFVFGDSGNLNQTITISFRGVDSTVFAGTTTKGTTANLSTYVAPAITTTTDNAIVIHAIGFDYDGDSSAATSSGTNSNLINISVIHAQTVATATGGGIGVVIGEKVSQGDTGATTYSAVSGVKTYITFALKPASTVENYNGAVSLTQASTVAALGTMGAEGAVSVSQASTISALGKKAVSGAVSVAQASSVTIAGTRSEASNDKTGSVSVSQASEVAILGKVGLNGAVSVSQGSSVAVSGKLGAKGTVSVAQGSSVSALGTMGANGSVSVADASSVTISGTKFVQTYEFFGRLDVAQTSNASVSGKKSVGGAVNVYQVSAIQASGKKNSSGSFSLAQASSVSIFGFRTIVKAFSLSSTVNLVRTRNGSLNGTKKHTSVYKNSKSLSSVLNDTYRKETKI